jgi:hypothetical protein
MIARGEGSSIVNIGSMWAHQAIGLTPSSDVPTGCRQGLYTRAVAVPCTRLGACWSRTAAVPTTYWQLQKPLSRHRPPVLTTVGNYGEELGANKLRTPARRVLDNSFGDSLDGPLDAPCHRWGRGLAARRVSRRGDPTRLLLAGRTARPAIDHQHQVAQVLHHLSASTTAPTVTDIKAAILKVTDRLPNPDQVSQVRRGLGP